jgi:hypothetical protein
MSNSGVELDREAIIEPADESQDYESILGSGNTSAFSRYAVPPQFDGNSSEDEQKEVVEEPEREVNDEEEDIAVEESQYAPLVADEFGDFVSSENFGDYYTPDVVVSLQDRLATDAQNSTRSEAKSDEPIGTPTSAQSVQSNVRVSIPPLDASKHHLPLRSVIYHTSSFLCEHSCAASQQTRFN